MSLQLKNWLEDDGINLTMINDVTRNYFYDNIMRDNVNGKVCVDVGFGTGLLSMLALKHGAKRIIAFEKDKLRYDLGMSMIAALGIENKISLFNYWYNDKDHGPLLEDAEIMFHEILGPSLWEEGLHSILPVHNNIRMLPDKYALEVYIIEISDQLAHGLVNPPAAHNAIKFCPGVDIDERFTEFINSELRKVAEVDNAYAPRCDNGIHIVNEHMRTIWFWSPSVRMSKMFPNIECNYIVNAATRTVTFVDSNGTRTSGLKECLDSTGLFELDIDMSRHQDKNVLIYCRPKISCGNHSLYIDEGAWGISIDPRVAINVKSDLVLRHWFRNEFGSVNFEIKEK